MDKKQGLEEARKLIKEKHFAEARLILVSIDHPTAKEWIAKIDERLTPALSSKVPPAYQLLLSKFLHPGPTEISNSSEWEAVLEESVLNALKRLGRAGLLERATLSEAFDFKYRVADLKAFLKERRLPSSGKKGELIERIIQADIAWANSLVEDTQLLRCTESGARFALDYLETQKQKRLDTEQQVKEALRKREFLLACQIVGQFEAGSKKWWPA